MKKMPTFFLRFIICLIGLGVLAAMIRFPQTEGRAANLDLVSIYTDPLILYTYLASLPFFFALYQGFSLLNLIDAGKAFSPASVRAFKMIKFSALTLIGSVVFALLIIRFFVHGDDPAGPTALGILLILALSVVAAISDICQKIFQTAATSVKQKNART